MPVTSIFAQIPIGGVVYDRQSGKGIIDVSILDANNDLLAITDSTGTFSFLSKSMSFKLNFRKLGYDTQVVHKVRAQEKLVIYLTPKNIELEEVQINTGYQWIPKERAAGSYVHLDRSKLDLIPGRSILEKLDGMMSGLQFDNRQNGATDEGESVITVRGLNTFSTHQSQPLIIVDDFPFDGGLEAINPEDIESVTLMRDAAATSIWGARAGNGVLVINLKKPKGDGQTIVNWSSNLSVTEKPNLYFDPKISSSDFVDVELFLYEKGHYNSALRGSNAYLTIFSPIVQALYDLDQGLISNEDVEKIIRDARITDYRDDMLKHFYKHAINQQHHVSIVKKIQNFGTRFSIGLDQISGATNRHRDNQRITFNFSNSYQFSPKINGTLNLNFSNLIRQDQGGISYPLVPGGGKNRMYPYLQMVDEFGKGLPIPKNLNPRFIDTIGAGQLLDWRFIPLDDIQHSLDESKTYNLSPSLTFKYTPIPNVQLEASYKGEFHFIKSEQIESVESYNVRNEINRFTHIDGSQVVRHIPMGSVMNYGNSNRFGHKLRLHAKMDQTILNSDRIFGVFGGELSDVLSNSSIQRVYGYDPFLKVSIPVDHVYMHPLLLGGTGSVPSVQQFNQGVKRMVSLYGNISYSRNDKYIFTASGRRDASNSFGSKSNERWNPLWSVGLAWNVHKEQFMETVNWISNLKLRITHGHSGNLGYGTTSTRVVINNNGSMPHTRLPSMRISSLPNSSLKWENVQINNIGVDFGLYQNQVTGSIEYFKKNVSDLISLDPIDPTLGFTSMNKNVGGISGEGLDLNLHFHLKSNDFSWQSNPSISYVKDWVTSYNGSTPTTSLLVASETSVRPIIGRSLVPIYSYKFAGLDPQTGDPLGLLDEEISKNYSRISRDSLANLNYHGSARPIFHGFLNNNFQFRKFSLFVNISFRAGHYYRKNTISYANLFNSWDSHSDYLNRWKEPGDEISTTVPSMVYPVNSARDNFYAGSEANIERGDVIRLQRIRLSYQITNPRWKINKIDLGINISNLGVLWSASKTERDPDYLGIPPSKVFSTNIRLQF